MVGNDRTLWLIFRNSMIRWVFKKGQTRNKLQNTSFKAAGKTQLKEGRVL